jgi:hypothetical protein
MQSGDRAPDLQQGHSPFADTACECGARTALNFASTEGAAGCRPVCIDSAGLPTFRSTEQDHAFGGMNSNQYCPLCTRGGRSWNRRRAYETPNILPAHMRCLDFRASAFRQLLSVLLDTWLDRATIQFRFFGHAATYTRSFCVFEPVLSSPAHGAPSLAMEPI